MWISGDAGAATELAQRAFAAVDVDGGRHRAAGLRLVLDGSGWRPTPHSAISVTCSSSPARCAGSSPALGPLDGADLQPAHADPEHGVDLDELESRIDAAQQALATRREALGALLDDPAPTLGAIHARGRRSRVRGGRRLAPLAGHDEDPGANGSAAFLSVSAVFADVTRRLGDAERERSAPAGEPEPARRD